MTMVHPTDIEMERKYKKKAFEDLLSNGRLYLTLDTRVKGVKVPSEHQGLSALTIVFGLDLPVPLDDMQVDRNGIAVTLSFERRPHHCVIPWDAVWYLVPAGDREGVLFGRSLPDSIRQQVETDGSALPLDLEKYLEDRCCKIEETPSRPRFEVIDGEASSLTTEEKHDDDKVESHRPPPLRLVHGGEGTDD